MASQLMTDEHKEKLKINRKVLVENIIVQYICSDLLQENIFTKRELDDISAQRTNQEKVEKLLDILATNSDEAYWKFIDVLKKSGRKHVANVLESSNFIIKQSRN